MGSLCATKYLCWYKIICTAVSNNKYEILLVGGVYVYCLSYEACKLHLSALYCIICGLSGSTLFLYIILKQHDF